MPGTTLRSAQSRLSSQCATTRKGHSSVDKLTLAHPLGDRTPMVLRELAAHVRPHAKILDLRGDRAVLAKEVPHSLPNDPNCSREYAGWRVLWMRPDGWL